MLLGQANLLSLNFTVLLQQHINLYLSQTKSIGSFC